MNIFIKMNCIEVMKAIKRKKESVGDKVIMSFRAHSRSPISITKSEDIERGKVPNWGSSAP
jgi:hypothetical protein